MKKVFLAGPIDNDIQYAYQWRLLASEALICSNFVPINPLRDIISTSTWTKYDNVTNDFIFRRDLMDLSSADHMLINLHTLDKVPSSTLVEIGLAYRDNTPIVGFGINSPSKLPLFVRQMVYLCSSLDAAIEALEAWYA